MRRIIPLTPPVTYTEDIATVNANLEILAEALEDNNEQLNTMRRISEKQFLNSLEQELHSLSSLDGRGRGFEIR